MTDRLLGFTDAELARSPFARFYNPDLAPLQPQVAEALLVGPQAHELFAPASAAAAMAEPGYAQVETGYTVPPGGGIRVFCLTNMPGVTPEMWDWWFGWHGCAAERYKLWHPKAHIDARWADGRIDESYIGRTSLITEYLGPRVVKGGIAFLPPAAMGFDEARLAAQGEVVICARVGVPGTPLKGGWLLHQLRPVAGGSEMRSRMWMGGENTAIGDDPGAVRRGLAKALAPVAGQLLPAPADLLVHNAQEMAHLAGFLPQLFEAFGAAYREQRA
jgi:DAPG hydrolase PhiG domain